MAGPILDHEDQLDLLSRSPCAEPDDHGVAVKRVGEELRNARELKGAQLGDVSRAVNIHPNYLAAIEDGRFADLPGRGFTIGYVARYARHLGVDVENVVDRLQSESTSGVGAFDDRIDVAPLPDRNVRPAVIAVALLLLAAVTWSADDIVALATGAYEQQKAVDAPRPADEQTPIAAATPPVPPPTGIAVTPPLSLRADLTPAAIEQARIAAIPLPTGIAVTPPASLRADLTPAAIEEARMAAIPLPTVVAITPPAPLRADLTPAAIRQETRVAALLPMPLPTAIAVTSPASLRADLTPASIREQIRIARIPLPARISATPAVSLRADLTPAAIEEARIAAIPPPAGIAVTPPASLRADLTPAAIREQTRVAALFPMPLPTEIAVTLPATLHADLEPAAIERALAVEARVAATPLPTRISVTPSVSPRDDLAQSVQTQLPPGRRLGLRNRTSRITLRVHRPTFVAVRGARGQIFLERRLAPGDTYRVPNRAGLRLTARDAGAVEIILDGDSLGFIGSRGLQASGLSLNPRTVVDRLRRF